ncbi:MAG: VWA domain-containing protein [Acidobacteria bacterium]|nr:VWA domain-containing protein [Acidobacteriota bacterium]
MKKTNFVRLSALILGATLGIVQGAAAQQGESLGPVFRIEVDMVLLNVAVTDNKGNYVTGLRPWDFVIQEDGIEQKMATFAEGHDAPRRLAEFVPGDSRPRLVQPFSARARSRLQDGNSSTPFLTEETPDQVAALVAGAGVFILFDTSNYMYRGFVFAQDAIAEFIRSLDSPDRVAFYAYSRDLHRMAAPSSDRLEVMRALRKTVAGDNAALYNALLLTLKDASQISGRKVIVVFSNGPDNASMIAPEDVRELAQAEGVPIYMISTREAQHDPVSTAVFERMSSSTGGKAYFAKNWKDQQQAFTSIRDDLAHLYSLSYYPQQNPNRGWRSITVKLVGDHLKKYQIRTRTGYRPRPVSVTQ